MNDRGVAAGVVGRRLIELNRRPFGRPEAAFYEFVAPAVLSIVAPVVEQELLEAPAGALLDVGCGGGAITARLQRPGRDVVGVDPSLPQLRRLRRRQQLPGVAAAAGALPFGRGAFAAVVSSCALKHWPSRLEGIGECAGARA